MGGGKYKSSKEEGDMKGQLLVKEMPFERLILLDRKRKC